VIVDLPTYSAIDEAHGVDILAEDKLPDDTPNAFKTTRHIFD
jgi:hypothetical protein